MRIPDPISRPVALGTLLTCLGVALAGCGEGTEVETISGPSEVPAPNQPTPGAAGTPADIEGGERGTGGGIATGGEGTPGGNPAHEPSGTYLDPEPPRAEGGVDDATGSLDELMPRGEGSGGVPRSVTGEGIQATVGAAGAEGAQGAAIEAANSPEQAAGAVGSTPAAPSGGDQPDAPPADEPGGSP